MTGMVDRLSEALADRYAIERELGAGGMATVYLAQDVRHQRRVAVKVLRPELAAALGHERFLREITTTANLRHPHILPLYDSGEAADFLFYVMPYVEGESLRDRLDREKQFPLADALQIAREVADALSYAHSRGVIHRDIKPENILLESGHAVVADFGIARAVDAAGGTQLTETGLAIGTPTYMSPEQAAGASALDGRSDLYALGCVLFEMLAGQPPFTGPTVESVIHQHLAVDAPPITNLRPAVPAEVAAALQRALAKTPADRFNPVAQFSDTLRVPLTPVTGTTPSPAAPSPPQGRVPTPVRAVVAVGVVIAAIAAIAFGLGRSRAPAGEAAPRSLAVLPFENIGGDPEAEYFSDGITEDIIAHVSKVAGLKVISRTSVMQFKGTTMLIPEIGEQLGVGAVLEGSVRRAGNRVRIVAQLIDVATDEHLWAETYDRELSDIFRIQTDVARNIATALGTVFAGSAATRRPPTGDMVAYDLYLRGRVFMASRTEEALLDAAAYFRQAVDRDPQFAQAYAGLADSWMLRGIYTSVLPRVALDSLEQAIDSALAFDPTLPGPHAVRGFVDTYWLWNPTAGEASLRESIRLDPSYATAYQWLGDMVAIGDRHDEAMTLLRRGQELDPLSRIIGTDMGTASFFARDFGAAEAQFRRVMELDPGFPVAYQRATWLYFATGRDSLVAEMLERWSAIEGQQLAPAGALRSAFASGGRRGLYERLLAAADRPGTTTDRALWLLALDRHAEAMDVLERAAERGDPWVFVTLHSALYDALRGNARYEALRTRVYGR